MGLRMTDQAAATMDDRFDNLSQDYWRRAGRAPGAHHQRVPRRARRRGAQLGRGQRRPPRAGPGQGPGRRLDPGVQLQGAGAGRRQHRGLAPPAHQPRARRAVPAGLDHRGRRRLTCSLAFASEPFRSIDVPRSGNTALGIRALDLLQYVRPSGGALQISPRGSNGLAPNSTARDGLGWGIQARREVCRVTWGTLVRADACAENSSGRAFAPMKIAMLGTRGVPATFGGVERHVEEIGRRLVDRGHEVTVYSQSRYVGRDRGARAPGHAGGAGAHAADEGPRGHRPLRDVHDGRDGRRLRRAALPRSRPGPGRAAAALPVGRARGADHPRPRR